MQLWVKALVGLSLSLGCSDPEPADEQAGCDELDEDGDGFPRTNAASICCDPECTGLIDCNDEDPDIHPPPSGEYSDDGRDDPGGDGIDSDCNGVDGP